MCKITFALKNRIVAPQRPTNDIDGLSGDQAVFGQDLDRQTEPLRARSAIEDIGVVSRLGDGGPTIAFVRRG